MYQSSICCRVCHITLFNEIKVMKSRRYLTRIAFYDVSYNTILTCNIFRSIFVSFLYWLQSDVSRARKLIHVKKYMFFGIKQFPLKW
jgi:hypothetical protein